VVKSEIEAGKKGRRGAVRCSEAQGPTKLGVNGPAEAEIPGESQANDAAGKRSVQSKKYFGAAGWRPFRRDFFSPARRGDGGF